MFGFVRFFPTSYACWVLFSGRRAHSVGSKENRPKHPKSDKRGRKRARSGCKNVTGSLFDDSLTLLPIFQIKKRAQVDFSQQCYILASSSSCKSVPGSIFDDCFTLLPFSGCKNVPGSIFDECFTLLPLFQVGKSLWGRKSNYFYQKSKEQLRKR